jgi:hypothetical protein
MRIAEIEGHPLIEKLKSAFADNEYPGDEAITGTPDSVEEAEDEFRQLRGRQSAHFK